VREGLIDVTGRFRGWRAWLEILPGFVQEAWHERAPIDEDLDPLTLNVNTLTLHVTRVHARFKYARRTYVYAGRKQNYTLAIKLKAIVDSVRRALSRPQ
jgi:hypothetical protein